MSLFRYLFRSRSAAAALDNGDVVAESTKISESPTKVYVEEPQVLNITEENLINASSKSASNIATTAPSKAIKSSAKEKEKPEKPAKPRTVKATKISKTAVTEHTENEMNGDADAEPDLDHENSTEKYTPDVIVTDKKDLRLYVSSCNCVTFAVRRRSDKVVTYYRCRDSNCHFRLRSQVRDNDSTWHVHQMGKHTHDSQVRDDHGIHVATSNEVDRLIHLNVRPSKIVESLRGTTSSTFIPSMKQIRNRKYYLTRRKILRKQVKENSKHHQQQDGSEAGDEVKETENDDAPMEVAV